MNLTSSWQFPQQARCLHRHDLVSCLFFLIFNIGLEAQTGVSGPKGIRVLSIRLLRASIAYEGLPGRRLLRSIVDPSGVAIAPGDPPADYRCFKVPARLADLTAQLLSESGKGGLEK